MTNEKLFHCMFICYVQKVKIWDTLVEYLKFMEKNKVSKSVNNIIVYFLTMTHVQFCELA